MPCEEGDARVWCFSQISKKPPKFARNSAHLAGKETMSCMSPAAIDAEVVVEVEDGLEGDLTYLRALAQFTS
ncbi:hypothetical protein RRF57_007981 [Xylaria bambusicola]|uniref:Uncharacterized protein n=1 Tax=Xylaria bambusicola TaxID=326684 RepID=A0AAN7Z6Q0_9PEZI